MNKTHPTIKFTSERDLQCITFLDVNIYKGLDFRDTHHLSCETHLKPTNKQLHVHAHSYQPMSTKKGVITGETKLLLRTNSRAEMFTTMVKRNETQLKRRGYPLPFTRQITEQIRFDQR